MTQSDPHESGAERFRQMIEAKAPLDPAPSSLALVREDIWAALEEARQQMSSKGYDCDVHRFGGTLTLTAHTGELPDVTLTFRPSDVEAAYEVLRTTGGGSAEYLASVAFDAITKDVVLGDLVDWLGESLPPASG